MKYSTLLMTSLIASAFISCSDPKAPAETGWSYEGKRGPSHWNNYSLVCRDGISQSPINIVTSATDSIMPENLLFMSASDVSQASVSKEKRYLELLMKGSNTITIKGLHYKLLTVSFHAGAEHTIDGKREAMEMQLLYKNGQDETAIIAVSLRKGSKSEVFEKLIDQMKVSRISINPAKLLPESMVKYFYYEGSLTTPPCSENIKWYIIKDSVELSGKQLKALSLSKTHTYRPLQKLNGRYIEAK